jgi:soluble cytochrome b562
MIQIDDWWEMIIAGVVIIGVLIVIYFIIKQFFNHGGNVKYNGIEIKKGDELPCINYVTEHSKMLVDLQATLTEMEKQRKDARIENSESNKVVQIMFRTLAISIDGLIEAFQKNNVGNGNLEKARKNLAKLYDVQDKYLIDQL